MTTRSIQNKQKKSAKHTVDLVKCLQNAMDHFCESTRWIDTEANDLSMAENEMFKIINDLEWFIEKTKKIQKKTGRKSDAQEFKCQAQLLGTLRQLRKFCSYFAEANSATNKIVAALDEFTSGIGDHIEALNLAKRAWKALENKTCEHGKV